MWANLAAVASLFLCSIVTQRQAGRLVRRARRADGAPTPARVRLGAVADLVTGAAALTALRLTGQQLPGITQARVHDPLLWLLFGVLGGLFLHLTGGGSPIPVAALKPPRLAGPGNRGSGADAGTVALFIVGEATSEFVWRGVVLALLLRLLATPLALLVAGAGYGLRRDAAGQDHRLLASVDGVLLGVLFLLTGSIVVAMLAHLVADGFAYVAAIAGEELEPAPSDALRARVTLKK